MMVSEKKNMHQALGDALLDMAKIDERVWFVNCDSVSLTGDSSFGDKYPDRYCNMGEAEQQLVMVSAGLALNGRKVCGAAFASTLTGRAFDQIRTLISLAELPVTLVGCHGGITVGPDGAVHQMLEDIALMRSLPNLDVLVPADYWSAYHLLKSALTSGKPSYVRLSRCDLPQIYSSSDSDLVRGSGRMLQEGEGVTICSCGIMVHEALKAADILSRQGLGAEIIDCYSVNPLPFQVILASIRRTGCCVVAEESSSRGGLGEAIATLVSGNYPVPVEFVSVENRFGQSGTPEELQEYYGLTHNQVVGSALQAWTMRRR